MEPDQFCAITLLLDFQHVLRKQGSFAGGLSIPLVLTYSAHLYLREEESEMRLSPRLFGLYKLGSYFKIKKFLCY